MEEFLTHFEIVIPPGTDPVLIAKLYEDEAAAAKPLFEGGWFRRVWRVPGQLGHRALWYAPDADFVHLAYMSFPLAKGGFGRATVEPLAVNSNDPGWPGDCVPNGDDSQIMRTTLKRAQGPATPPRDAD